jgi:hypothetical protein
MKKPAHPAPPQEGRGFVVCQLTPSLANAVVQFVAIACCASANFTFFEHTAR